MKRGILCFKGFLASSGLAAMEVNWAYSLLCLPLLFSTISESCLDGTTEPLISGSRYRVQDQFFEADSVDGNYTPQQARLGRDSWCSSDSLTASSEHPWLQVTFTKEFNISVIQTGGYDGFSNYYLTSFQVHIGNGTEGSLRPLTMSDNSTQPLVFVRTMSHDIEDTVLPSPVIARVLRIVAVGWTPQNQVCLRLEALGCSISPEPCLNSTIEQVISGSRYKVPDVDIKANSAVSSYTPQQARLEGNSWCSSDSLTASSELPWLQVTFGMDFNIFIIQTGGFNGGFFSADHYVTKFEVHVGDTEGSLHPLTISNEPSQPMVFVRKGTHNIENTTLPSVVTAKVLRIVVVEWTPKNQVCLRLEALGCLSSPDPMTTTEPYTEVTPHTTQETPTTGEISEATSYATQETTTTGEISEATSNSMQEINLGSPQSRSRVAIVGGAVGGGMSLLVALLLLILVVEAILIYTRKKRARVQLTENCEAIPEHMCKNAIYGKERALPIPSNNVPGSSSKGEIKTENHLGMPGIPSSMMSNIYESIPAPTPIIHDPIEDLSGSMDPHDEEMDDNPLYGKDSEEDFKMECHPGIPGNPSSKMSNTYESIAATTSVLHETVEDLNGIVDPRGEGMHDNPIYDISSEDDFQMDCDLARSSSPSSTTLST